MPMFSIIHVYVYQHTLNVSKHKLFTDVTNYWAHSLLGLEALQWLAAKFMLGPVSYLTVSWCSIWVNIGNIRVSMTFMADISECPFAICFIAITQWHLIWKRYQFKRRRYLQPFVRTTSYTCLCYQEVSSNVHMIMYNSVIDSLLQNVKRMSNVRWTNV